MGNSNKRQSIPSNLLEPPPHVQCDIKAVKKQILERKLAPFFVPREDKLQPDDEECPICFNYYNGGLNRSVCCKKGICTACYLVIRSKHPTPSCPFCQQKSYTVKFTGPLTKEELEKEAEEERKVEELLAKMRMEEYEREKERQELLKRQSLPNPLPSGQDGDAKEATDTAATARTKKRKAGSVAAQPSSASTAQRNAASAAEAQSMPTPQHTATTRNEQPPQSQSHLNQEHFVDPFAIEMFNEILQNDEALPAELIEEILLAEAIRRSMLDAPPQALHDNAVSNSANADSDVVSLSPYSVNMAAETASQPSTGHTNSSSASYNPSSSTTTSYNPFYEAIDGVDPFLASIDETGFKRSSSIDSSTSESSSEEESLMAPSRPSRRAP